MESARSNTFSLEGEGRVQKEPEMRVSFNPSPLFAFTHRPSPLKRRGGTRTPHPCSHRSQALSP